MTPTGKYRQRMRCPRLAKHGLVPLNRPCSWSPTGDERISHAVYIADMWARSIASLGRGLPLLHLTAQLLCNTNISWRCPDPEPRSEPSWLCGMRLQPFTGRTSTKSPVTAGEATHVSPRQSHNAIVVTVTPRCTQLVGMTVRMSAPKKATTIPCRAITPL